jgi:hypothetical protein
LQYISGMRRASRGRGGQARALSAVREERESMVVPRGQGEAEEHSSSVDSAPEFVSVPSRTLVIPEAERTRETREPDSDATTVVEREEWTRARDQIALIVRTTVAEAMLPLQESIALIAERLDLLASQQVHPPPRAEQAPPRPPPAPRATMLPPPLPHDMPIEYTPPPMAPSALTRLGDLAGRLRRERGIEVSPMQLAALLLERVAAVLDERVAEELARSSMFKGSGTSSDDDRSS